MVECLNVPLTTAAAISAELATLEQLYTFYSLEDVYDLLEIAEVRAHNSEQMSNA